MRLGWLAGPDAEGCLRFTKVATMAPAQSEEEVKVVAQMRPLYADQEYRPSPSSFQYAAPLAPAPAYRSAPLTFLVSPVVGTKAGLDRPYHDDRVADYGAPYAGYAPGPRYAAYDNRHLAMDFERRPHVAAALRYQRNDSVLKRLGWRQAQGLYGGGFSRGFRGYRSSCSTSTGTLGMRQRLVQAATGGAAGAGSGAAAEGTGGEASAAAGGGTRGGGGGAGGRSGRGAGGPSSRWVGGRVGGRRKWERERWVQTTREDLDAQLDAYMSKSKAGLDSELDNYVQSIPVLSS